MPFTSMVAYLDITPESLFESSSLSSSSLVHVSDLFELGFVFSVLYLVAILVDPAAD